MSKEYNAYFLHPFIISILYDKEGTTFSGNHSAHPISSQESEHGKQYIPKHHVFFFSTKVAIFGKFGDIHEDNAINKK